MRQFKRLLTLTMFCITYNSTFSQIGLGTQIYSGRDANQIKPSSAFDAQIFFPLFFPIYEKKDTTAIFVLSYPAIKFFGYNFQQNLVVDRQNNYTTFIEDTNTSHIYKRGFLKNRSQMNFISFYMPTNVVFWSKKLKGVSFAPGFYIEYIISGNFKRLYYENNNKVIITDKFRDDKDYYGLNRFQYGLCGHITYKFLTVYGIYTLSPLFKPDQGISVNKFQVGLWINFFYKQRGIKPY